MPITTKRGSIFDSTAQVLVCPVNCVGVMDKGLALEFKKRYPKECEYYAYACKHGILILGGEYTFGRIMFVATKGHWKDPSELEWVNSCLINIRYEAKTNKKSIAIPQLGCGCGGLDWADLWPLYEKHLGNLEATIEVWIHE